MAKRHTPDGPRAGLRTGFDVARGAWSRIRGRPLVYPEFGSQTIEADDVALVEDALLKSSAWSQEDPIDQFQAEFARWNGSAAAFAFTGGRVALSAAIYALGLRQGDEVVIPAYTCIVVPNAFAFAGITVRYCDIELETFGPDIRSLEKAITPKTKAVLVQHLYGLVARDFEKILGFAAGHNLRVIEDCAHATGAIFKGRRVGNWGDVAFYSSEQSKIYSTFNGGVAVSNSPEIVEGLRAFHRDSPFPSEERTQRLLRNVVYQYLCQKSPNRWFMRAIWDYQYRDQLLLSTTDQELQGQQPSFYRQKMPAPLAQLALNQLHKVDRYNQTRRLNADKWNAQCISMGLMPPTVIPESTPAFLRYPVMVPAGKKYDTDWCLSNFGVMPGHWFTGELHPLEKPMTHCPNARLAVERCLNLPTLP